MEKWFCEDFDIGLEYTHVVKAEANLVSRGFVL